MVLTKRLPHQERMVNAHVYYGTRKRLCTECGNAYVEYILLQKDRECIVFFAGRKARNVTNAYMEYILLQKDRESIVFFCR